MPGARGPLRVADDIIALWTRCRDCTLKPLALAGGGCKQRAERVMKRRRQEEKTGEEGGGGNPDWTVLLKQAGF